MFGSWVQLLGFFSVVITFALAFSKFGNIRFGEGRPQYSTTGRMFMFICTGLGSATMYWAFMEWGYYYLTPGLGIAQASPKALEYSIAYSFFHWGITPWAMYVIASLAMAYHFYVQRNKCLSLASVVEAITGLNARGPAGWVIDLIFLLATFGGLVLTTSTVSRGLSDLIGVTDGFALKATLVVLVTLVFSLTSYVGISFCGGDFSRDWTAFYWLYWTTYTPGVAIFVTRV
ncbi:BCCT family transporter [Pseudomonas syringae pv. syringae]|uniref:BCCT family transporter n=1 Tax=Pseudomonas syringae TaxID=317 RepID=UPI0023F91C75|nr:BCCT family transporter [Pseudomonas syringae]MDF5890316.1 BCCT family transporter [Pseudomonas syringae pv. syringae]